MYVQLSERTHQSRFVFTSVLHCTFMASRKRKRRSLLTVPRASPAQRTKNVALADALLDQKIDSVIRRMLEEGAQANVPSLSTLEFATEIPDYPLFRTVSLSTIER